MKKPFIWRDWTRSKEAFKRRFWTRSNQASQRGSADVRACLLLAAVVLATCLPFVGRAYFVDDFYHMEMAKGILEHPLRPYDFRTDDNGRQVPGWERGMRPRMVNPPLFHYLMAGVMKAGGTRVWALRTASLAFAIVALVCLYFLGKRWTAHPLQAALLMAVTPAFWLTSYSLLIDSGLIAFFAATLLVFQQALERRSLGRAAWAGVLMGLTILVKYFGVLVIPVVFLLQWRDPAARRWRGFWVAIGVCLALQAVWAMWNVATYGQSHFWMTLPRGAHSTSFGGALFLALLLGALFARGRWIFRNQSLSRPLALGAAALAVLVIGAGNATSIAAWTQGFYVDKVIVLGGFISGSFLFLWLAPVLLGARAPRRMGLVGLFVVALAFILQSRAGGFPLTLAWFLALLAGATLSGLLVESSTPAEALLTAWIALGLLELVAVMPWTAARYLLLVLPPFAWLFVERAQTRPWMWRSAMVLSVIVGGVLAASDRAQADVIVRLATLLKERAPQLQAMAPKPEKRWYYLADTFDGSQPYLLPLGWENAFPDQPFKPGDLFLRSIYRKSSWWTMKERERFNLVFAVDMTTAWPLRVMDVPGSAGWYASCWGALPWIRTDHPLERFELYQAK